MATASYTAQDLEKHKFASRQVYNHYLNEIKKVRLEQKKELGKRRKSFQHLKIQLEKQIEETKKLVLDETDSEIKNIFKKELKELSSKLKGFINSLEKISQVIKVGKTAVYKHSEFVELFNKLLSN